MDRRFTTFAILAALVFVANQLIFTYFFPPKPQPKADPKAVAIAKAEAEAKQKEAAKAGNAAPEGEKPEQAEAAADAKPAEKADDNAADKNAVVEAAEEPQWGSLGSADPASPYRVLVTWTNQGAAIERLELNSARYHDLEDRHGYLGRLEPADAPRGDGASIHVVGAGTPAAVAGLQAGDVIKSIDDEIVTSADSLIEALGTTKPDQKIEITIDRKGEPQKLSALLTWHPLQVIRPEYETKALDVVRPGKHDPFSFLTTIQQLGDRTLGDDLSELGGVHLHDSAWKVIAANADIVKFQKELPKLGLLVTKTFRLAKVPDDQLADADYPAYNLYLDVAIKNVGKKEQKVAYRLQGPTGLPTEGAWYANKVSHSWGSAGMRDVIVQFDGGTLDQITCTELSDPEFKRSFASSPLDFIAVDGIYFASAVLPQKDKPGDVLFAEVKPIRVGAIPTDKARYKMTNISFRLDSVSADLQPDGLLEHHHQLFAGPKKPALLTQYGTPESNLGKLIYYGYFGIVARPMLAILHAFYHIVHNYGLAIIMLTVLVRGCMFPVSRKQALGAQKMQELQPEIKRLQEKYKNDTKKKTEAQQELFRQHKYNPLSGCLPALVQLPIFVGLYRSLMVDVELRQAPLFGENIRWASNLSAPDMFWNWTGLMPEFITHGTGFFALGPYLNILPLVTVGLFLWQQRMFMPPPADEQAALQQKMMQYMMIFMGIMFFKVASGLCIYFIASSIWGICERKLLPKKTPVVAGAGDTSVALDISRNGGNNGAAAGKKRQRGRR